MNILIITKTIFRGGAASGNGRIIENLKLADVHVNVVTADNVSQLTNIIRKIERVFDYIFVGRESHAFRFWGYSIDIEKLIDFHDPDVVYFGDVSGNIVDYSSLSLSNLFVVHRLSDFYPYGGVSHYNPAKQWLWRPKPLKPDFCICPSEWIMDKLLQLQPTLLSKAHLIRNTGPYDYVEAVKNLSNLKTYKLGFISSNIRDERKNLKGLIRHLDACIEFIDFELHVYGKGKLDFTRNYMKLRGSFNASEINEVYSNFDILVIPSILDNSPNVIIEAYGHGVPVIASSTSGLQEYVHENHTGNLFNFDSENNSKLLMSKILTIGSNYKHFSDSCVEVYNTHYTPAATVNSLLAELEKEFDEHRKKNHQSFK